MPPSADEVGRELAGTGRDLPDINIVHHAGRLLAMAESAQPYRLHPCDLSTLGRTDCDGAMAIGSTAHPKIDPATGELVLFNYVLEAPYLTWSVVGADGTTLRTPTPVDGVTEPLMIHDMALTSRYIVLVLSPLVFDVAGVMKGGSLLNWRPEQGTRIALILRDGGMVRWIHTDAFWVWHFGNAFDRPDGTVVVDYVEWAYPSGLAKSFGPQVGSFVRAEIDPVGGRFTRSFVVQQSMEFPRIDDRCITREHGTTATAGKLRADTSGQMDSLWFIDPDKGSVGHWDAGTLAVGEPIFLPGNENDHWARSAPTSRT